MTGSVRRAGVDDVEALTDLRAIMLDTLAEGPPAAGDPRWRSETVAWFRACLAERSRFAAFVADDPALGTVACAVGSLSEGAPMPGDSRPLRGHVFSVATDPRARRQGHARACTVAVLAWLDLHDAATVELTATPGGAPMYRDLGFAERPWVTMRRR